MSVSHQHEDEIKYVRVSEIGAIPQISKSKRQMFQIQRTTFVNNGKKF